MILVADVRSSFVPVLGLAAVSPSWADLSIGAVRLSQVLAANNIGKGKEERQSGHL